MTIAFKPYQGNDVKPSLRRHEKEALIANYKANGEAK